MIFISDSSAFVQSTSFPDCFTLKLFSYKIPLRIPRIPFTSGESRQHPEHVVLPRDQPPLGSCGLTWGFSAGPTDALTNDFLLNLLRRTVNFRRPERTRMEGTQFCEATVVKSLCVCVLAGWQRMEVMLPYTTNRILNVEEAGGKLLPRWFGAANFVEVHPSPYTLHPAPYISHPTPHTLHPAPYTCLPAQERTGEKRERGT